MTGNYIMLECRCFSFFFLLCSRQLLIIVRFADRDLMMRFRGGGVGHKSTREATDFFKKDRDRLDEPGLTEMDDAETTSEDDGDGDEDSVDEDVEDDYGYTMEVSDEGEPDHDGVEVDDDDGCFGPEDDGGGVDPDMEELGYAGL